MGVSCTTISGCVKPTFDPVTQCVRHTESVHVFPRNVSHPTHTAHGGVCLQTLRAVSSKRLANQVFSSPQLQQSLKEDLLWQLHLAQDIQQEQVGDRHTSSTMCTLDLGSVLAAHSKCAQLVEY